MNELINLDSMDYGIFNRKGLPVVSSRKVAEVFKKRHDNVLADIREILASLPSVGESEFSLLHFQESNYSVRGKKYPEFLMDKDGFSILAMGFTGKKAMKFKVAYINRFNEMEQFIENLEAARLEYPELTGLIAKLHKEPKQYHFSGEADLFNMIVLKMRARDYKKIHNLKVQSIRPHLKPEELEAIMKLQRADIGLAMVVPEYEKRKELLKSYYQQLNNNQALPEFKKAVSE